MDIDEIEELLKRDNVRYVVSRFLLVACAGVGMAIFTRAAVVSIAKFNMKLEADIRSSMAQESMADSLKKLVARR